MAESEDSQEVFPKLLEWCRTCAIKPKGKMKNLFTTCVNKMSLAGRLEICFRKPICENDGLPSNICSGCSSKLNVAYEFYIMCSASENKFQKLCAKQLVNKIKDEAIEEFIDNAEGNILTDRVFAQDESEATLNNIGSQGGLFNISPENIMTRGKNIECKELTPERQHCEQIDVKPPIIYNQDENTAILCHQIHNDVITDDAAHNLTAPVVSDRVKSAKKHNRNRSSRKGRKKTYECYRCKAVFKGRTLLRYHMEFCDQPNKFETFECSVCKERFETNQAYKQHKIKFNHMTAEDLLWKRNDKVYQCEYCMKPYKIMKVLVQHVKSHENLNVYECDQCPNKYSLKVQLDEHIRFHAGERNYVCDQCSKEFMLLSNLKKHKKVHSSETHYLCSDCGKSFRDGNNLRQHSKILSANAICFKCTQCPMQCASKSILEKHMTIHSDERKYPCDECSARFKTKITLKNHKQRHAGDRRYPCTMCEKRFYTTGHLKTHIRKHTGEKPFKCEFCDRAYAQKNDLVKHKRTHVGDNIYQCKFCPNAFRFQIELRGHILDHYKKQKDKVNDNSDEADLTLLGKMEQEWKKCLTCNM